MDFPLELLSGNYPDRDIIDILPEVIRRDYKGIYLYLEE
jgi:hypothetical protein